MISPPADSHWTTSSRCLLLVAAARAPYAAALRSLRDPVGPDGVAFGAERADVCSPGKPRIPEVDNQTWEETWNQKDITQWWQQPMKKCEHGADHWEKEYMPEDLRKFWFESHVAPTA